jgi:hypothetical protein
MNESKRDSPDHGQEGETGIYIIVEHEENLQIGRVLTAFAMMMSIPPKFSIVFSTSNPLSAIELQS